MVKGIKKIVLSTFVTIGLFGNVFVTHAEETGMSVIQEEIVELELNASGEQFDINEDKNADIISEEMYIGDFDTKAMPVADGENTSANDARAIQTNSLVNDAITEEGQQRWYFFLAEAGKLTLNLDFTNSTSVDYDLYLYLYDDTSGTISLIDGTETSNHIEHFSKIVDTGIYFVLVNGYSGYDATNPYTLGTVLSTSYDAQEVDDRFQDAYDIASLEFNVTGTIDNRFDADIQKYTVSKTGRMYISLTNNGSTNNIYAVDLLNENGVKLAFLNQNTKYTIDIPQGTYYFKVYCSTFGGDYTSTYSLKGEVRTQAARAEVTHAGDADQPIVDYVDGPYWRVYGTSYVEGLAYDSNGYIMPNADVTIIVDTKTYGKISNSGRTDSQGKFKIQLNIGNGKGDYSYISSVNSIHYYDIVAVDFKSNGTEIRSNVDYFYHFAYQLGPFSA